MHVTKMRKLIIIILHIPIKNAQEDAFEILVWVFRKFLKGEEVPFEWKQANLTLLYKKGDWHKYKNYCGINGTCSVRLYGWILKNQVEATIHDTEEQSGFLMGKSYINIVFCLK